MIYELPSKPSAVAYLTAGRDPNTLMDRVNGWLSERGYVRGDMGTAVRSDGVIIVDTDRDPRAEWSDFDPNTEVGQYAADRLERDRAKQAITALQAGTLSVANTQKVIAWLVNRELDRMGG